jgi:hypothetical protein
LEKFPPGALHVEAVAAPPMIPDRFTDSPAQIVCGLPAFAVGGFAQEQLFTVITTVEVATGHGPEGSFVVKVRITVPFETDGVYIDVTEFTSEKFPLGALHVEVDALPPIIPAKVIDPPAHTVCGFPAFAVAGALTVIVTVDDAAVQGPVPSGSFVVNVKVTVPLVIEGV